MKRCFAFFLTLLSLLGQVGAVWAQQGPWRNLPADQRREMRQQMREHWQQEREMNRTSGEAPHWRDLPQEDRRRLREEIREQRGWPDQRNGGGHGWRHD